MKFYSSGMYVRLAFAVAVHVDPDVLLVDEVLAVGDEPFQRKCMDRIRAFQQRAARSSSCPTRSTRSPNCATGSCSSTARSRSTATRGRRCGTCAPTSRSPGGPSVNRSATTSKPAGRAGGPPSGKSCSRPRTGPPSAQPRSGADLLVRIGVEAEDRLVDWLAGVSIENSAGQIAFGTNSRLLGSHLPPLHGRGTVDIAIRGLWLGEGIYRVQVAIAEASGVEIDRVPDGAELVVRTDGRGVGILSAVASVTLSG